MSEVRVHVYDLVEHNAYISWAGIGAYHSGVEVYSREWSFGGGDFDSTGVFDSAPGECANEFCRFRETVVLGQTKLSRREVDQVISRLKSQWIASSYDILERNCNDFCHALVSELLGIGLPPYINRLAKMASLFRCVLPASLVGARGPAPMAAVPSAAGTNSSVAAIRVPSARATAAGAAAEPVRFAAFSGNGRSLGSS